MHQYIDFRSHRRATVVAAENGYGNLRPVEFILLSLPLLVVSILSLLVLLLGT
jgi:hypothetical protein